MESIFEKSTVRSLAYATELIALFEVFNLYPWLLLSSHHSRGSINI